MTTHKSVFAARNRFMWSGEMGHIVLSIHFPSYFKQLPEVNLKYNFSKATFLQKTRAVYAEFFSKYNVIK